ncbi:hypothetical protein FHS14_004826 [Paenibacillus baekrokdamisoli]|nr:hypothetical protein [Paenibacillus baekrokdamisoli]
MKIVLVGKQALSKQIIYGIHDSIHSFIRGGTSQ